ncbi:hypothetical protein, partial [Crenobacter caeni]|uniref:hypothetical protein n=1 Tax=Crenobacter caeni TaxID=2705474 RepID=UPI00193F3F2F
NSSVQSLTFSYFWHASPKKLSFPSLAVQVLAAPSTHTYRLFVLLKSSADFVSFASSAEEANYTDRTLCRQPCLAHYFHKPACRGSFMPAA